jgi:hypothetical protein
MKGFRTAVMAAALVMAVSSIAAAQGGGGGGGGGGRGGQRGGGGRGGVRNLPPEQQADSLLKGITVSADVKTQVVAALKTYADEYAKLVPARGQGGGGGGGGGGGAARGGGGGGGGGRAGMDSTTLTKMNDLATARDAAIKKLLNADQQKTYDANVAMYLPARGGRRGGGGF